MNQAALCALSVVPVRAEPSDKAEIVTQVLFGEFVSILAHPKDKKNWCLIRCAWDNYEGWTDIRQFKLIDTAENSSTTEGGGQEDSYCLDLVGTLINNDHFLPITMGATLPQYDGLNVYLGDKHYTFNGHVLRSATWKSLTENPAQKAAFIIKLARRYLFAPYLWGGRSPFGIDCSGFTQIVHKMVGIQLRRDASQQVEQGKTIDFLEQTQPADLAFFDNDKGNIIHVGIILGDRTIIHAAGQVRIDKLDHYGIFNEERGVYTHKLRIIKRLLPDIEPTETTFDNNAEVESAPDNQMSMF